MLDSVTAAATAYLKERTSKIVLRVTSSQSLQALPNVNNRDRLGEDSTEKIGAAEVDQKKVVIAFKKLFPKDHACTDSQ